MQIKYSIKTAVNGLRTHKSRSALTILGIVIGITSIIMVMSLGAGAQNLILGEIQGTIGSKVIEIRPGKEPKGPTDVMGIMFLDSLKQKDVDALSKKANVPSVTGVMPLVVGSETVTYGSETYSGAYYGVNQLATRMYNMIPVDGRFMTEEEVKGFADVAIIGNKVKEELFAGKDKVLGEKIRIKGKNFRIIGILPEKGSGIVSFDTIVIVPYTTAQQYLSGKKYFQHIVVEVDSEDNVSRTIEDIKITLRDSHNITNPEDDDFSLGSQADAMKMVGSVMDTLTLFLVAVAAISLVVGGVGIMNIMLVSVTERTKEIGLRKALGATDRDILVQFLLEAVILTAVGGLIGIILGSGLSLITSVLINRFAALNWTFSFPWGGAFLGLGVSSLIGLVFGIYPARQAAKKSPMEALRYE
jgi:putative ABC transport system permease protein